MHSPLCTRFNVENAGGFFCGGSKGMFPDSRKPLLPAPGGCWEGKSAPAGRRFWNERSTDEKEKTYDKRCEWDEEKCGRPALGRTRKLTRGVTVKFSPVSYEALRFRAGKSGRSLAVYIREAALAATVTARHTPEENALLRSLAGMANNLNQLTKLSHQTGFYRTRLLIEGLLGKLKRIMDDYRPKGG